MAAPYSIRKPTLRDAAGIQKLIQYYAERKLMLPRTVTQIYESLRDFHICEQEEEIVGCGALHLWSDLAEIRSLAVGESSWRLGVGSAIVNACLDEARAFGVKTVFVLTYQPDFFATLGFQRVPKDRFPHKIWVDCANCPQFPNCTETALILELPAP
jgi:amino-acid N-acetyltransferase